MVWWTLSEKCLKSVTKLNSSTIIKDSKWKFKKSFTEAIKKDQIISKHNQIDWLILMTYQPVWGYFMSGYCGHCKFIFIFFVVSKSFDIWSLVFFVNKKLFANRSIWQINGTLTVQSGLMSKRLL